MWWMTCPIIGYRYYNNASSLVMKMQKHSLRYIIPKEISNCFGSFFSLRSFRYHYIFHILTDLRMLHWMDTLGVTKINLTTYSYKILHQCYEWFSDQRYFRDVVFISVFTKIYFLIYPLKGNYYREIDTTGYVFSVCSYILQLPPFYQKLIDT